MPKFRDSETICMSSPSAGSARAIASVLVSAAVVDINQLAGQRPLERRAHARFRAAAHAIARAKPPRCASARQWKVLARRRDWAAARPGSGWGAARWDPRRTSGLRPDRVRGWAQETTASRARRGPPQSIGFRSRWSPALFPIWPTYSAIGSGCRGALARLTSSGRGSMPV